MSFSSRVRRSILATTEVDRLLRRINCQLDFASAISDSDAVVNARRQLESTNIDDLDALKSAVVQAEADLISIAEEAKKFTIHLIGHGHIDMNWMWSWPETCATTHDTFASVLALMEQYPELTFTQSQASVYAIIEKYHPAMFEKIKARVKEGRWEPAAVHWVEGDKNLASGEALAHHLLYTRRYFQEKFGLSPEDITLDWEPDTFGHCNTLPGILKQGGVKYYYCCRPGGGQEHLRVGGERPPMFWWEGPDGSRVLVCRETTWYNSYVEIGDNFALPAAAFWKKTGLKDWMNVYGIGNHGGGPTREEIDYFLETRDWPCWPTIHFGTAQKWFEKVEPLCGNMPVIDHELNFEFTGCYSSQSAIKKANRYGENYCVEAETLAALTTSGSKGLLRDAWINVLFNQFHDILPGSGVAATRDHALGLFQETGAITGSIKRNALQEIARNLNTLALLPDTPEAREERARISHPHPFGDAQGITPPSKTNHFKGGGSINTPFQAGAGQGAGESGFSRASGGGDRFRPIMIYNPCAWERSELVTVSLYDLPKDVSDDALVALNESGAAYPTLNVTGAIGGTHDWGHRRTDLLFLAKDIPALGYKVFLFCEGEATAEVNEVRTKDEVSFDTKELAIVLDKFEGGLKELHHKESRQKLSGSIFSLGSWEYVVEWPTGMSSWLLGGNRGKEDAQLLRQRETLVSTSFSVCGNARSESTARRSGSNFAILATNQMQTSNAVNKIWLRTLLSGGGTRVDFSADIDWQEIGSKTKGIPGLVIDFEFGRFDLNSRVEQTYETAFGVVNRSGSDGNEVPSLRFAHLWSPRGSEEIKGLTIVQDSKYSHSYSGNTLQLRVLRSSYEPDHAPEVAKSSMRYALVFHKQKPSDAELVRLGTAFNHPLIAVPTLLQEGTAPLSRSFVRVETDDVVLSTLKCSEDGDALILRLVNYSSWDTTAHITIDSNLLVGRTTAAVCDLMERSIAGGVSIAGTNLAVEIGANSFVTVRVE